MPIFEIEQYELHAMKYRVAADSEAEAIAMLFDGEAEPVEQSQEYIEVAEDYGMSTDDFPKLAKALRDRDVSVGEHIIPSIRSIEVVCHDEDTKDAESNVPCVACGRTDLPLHTDGRCGACGPGPTTGDQTASGIEIRLPCYGITIRLDHDPASGDPGCSTITSDLKAKDATVSPFNNAIDGLEAIILAHASAGIDVASPAYVEGIESAVDAIGNHFGQ